MIYIRRSDRSGSGSASAELQRVHKIVAMRGVAFLVWASTSRGQQNLMRAICSKLRSAPLAIIPLLASTTMSLATANCQTQGQAFRVEQSDRVAFRSTMDGEGCRYVYARFQKAVIMKQPENGSLTQVGEFSFLYKPRPGFTGKDSYVIYICAVNYRGSGCSRLIYEAIVQ